MKDVYFPSKVNSKELILKKAFSLFLEYNLEKVTVTELEFAIKLQRGAIFYHFKDKEQIFNQVIDSFFFSNTNILYPLDSSKVATLKEYIYLKINHLNKIFKWFKKEGIAVNPISGYLHLIDQANIYYPNFNEKFDCFKNKDIAYWQSIVQRSVENKEVKSFIKQENLVELFRFTYYGELFENAYKIKKSNNKIGTNLSIYALYESVCNL